MKFYRVTTAQDGEAIPDKGKLTTPSLEAELSYRFDDDDGTIHINIDDMWFDGEDLDYLIAFLKFAKTQLKK